MVDQLWPDFLEKFDPIKTSHRLIPEFPLKSLINFWNHNDINYPILIQKKRFSFIVLSLWAKPENQIFPLGELPNITI